MITHLRGKLVEKNKSYLIIDCHGIGYHVYISSYTYSFLIKEKEGKNVYIYTYLFIRDNQHVLYGFFQKIERKIFIYLIYVNGIGPNLAIVILSSINPYEIIECIYKEDVQSFKGVKGIGIKMAQRIIIELKEKISKEIHKKEKHEKLLKNESYLIKKEALSALNALGISFKNSNKILENILNNHPKFSVEDVIKEFLKKL
ncbi:Holliday junction branch migration protein RuvA [Blattabacterium cuenoti]|uniref:Holliday junction branch migration protein RuvA n=1 Tax=Blattabacterium cuenoti TaxID=1653831 RepID=UPI00163D26C4|nr:Holliday junction branch migration protein RuvA [Blattabacterium cuenoti]